MAESVVGAAARHPRKTWHEKLRSWRARKVADTARSRKGGDTAPTKMVERKTSERRLNHGKVRRGPEQTKKMVRHGYTNKEDNNGAEKHKENTVRSETQYTQGVSLAGGRKRRSRRSADVKKRGMAGRTQHVTEWDVKEKRSFSRGTGTSTPKHHAQNTRRANLFLHHPPIRCSKKDLLKVKFRLKKKYSLVSAAMEG